MKNRRYLLFAVVALLIRTINADCQFQGHSAMGLKESVNGARFPIMTSDTIISKEEAITIARHAVGSSMSLPEDGEVTVELKGEQYIVIFVHKLAPGVRGADYDAKVYLDARTGEVAKILVGS